MKCKTTFIRGDVQTVFPDAIFFDLDGTLIDSAPDIRACLLDALRENDLFAERMDERFEIGPPLDLMIRTMVPGVSEAALVAAVQSFRKRYDQSDYPLTVAFAGIEDLLFELSSFGLPLYVATNKPGFASTRIINKNGWNHFFEAILSPDVIKGMRLTKAQMLIRTASDNGYNPKNCMMVGDLRDDIDAARTAGFFSVAVTWGYGDKSILLQCGADRVVSCPAEISVIAKGEKDV